MAAKAKLPSLPTLLRWRDEEGLTHKQIAQRVSEQEGVPVSRSAVSVALLRAGETSEKPRYDDIIPWGVTAKWNTQWPLQMLRRVARQRRGMTLSDGEQKGLLSWMAALQEGSVVVAYHPDTGLWYVPRQDGDLEFTRPEVLTDKPRFGQRHITQRK